MSESQEFFRKSLISWYFNNKRDLPWRNTNDPYMIWLSEIILQQTRVNQGLPYFERFVEEYPTIFDLANARLEEVLRTWQGLGYYSRARNMHSCAKIIVNEYKGKFPNDFKKLRELPGIGEYTASAIATFAFHQPKAVVDGNVFRVLSRVYGKTDDIASEAGKKNFKRLADDLLDQQDPYHYNQAIMEFGALCCVPKNPDCSSCFLASVCFANQNQMQDQLPVKKKKKSIRKRFFTYLVFENEGGDLLMKQRNEKDIWQGLYDFPMVESKEELPGIEEVLSSSIPNHLFSNTPDIIDVSPEYIHILSHQRIQTLFIRIKINEKDKANINTIFPETEWISLENVAGLPKPILIVNYLNASIF